MKIKSHLLDILAKGESVDDFTHNETRDYEPNKKEHESRPHAVILIHGINTRAEWQDSVGNLLERDSTIRAVKPTYGDFDVLRFISPTNFFAEKAVNKIIDCIEAEKNKPQIEQISVIAHSFGTFILSKILEEKDHIDFDRIILCGSIIRSDFNWSKYRRKVGNSYTEGKFIINEVATKDLLPVLADTLTHVYGSSGRFGFEQPGHVENRKHKIFHSDYFEEAFVEKYWMPFFTENKVVSGEQDIPKTPFFVSKLPLIRNILIVAFLIYYGVNFNVLSMIKHLF